jgi:hypothetical protein
LRAVAVFVLITLVVQVGGCAASARSEVAGVYDLDSSAVLELAAGGVDAVEDPGEKLAMGMALTMLQRLTVSLHLEEDGTAYVRGLEPERTGSWSVSGETVTALLGTEGDDADRYEATLRDGRLVVPAGGATELPFELVFERRRVE